eukprot:6345190-Lingulodinium_polyedra.AAC.1
MGTSEPPPGDLWNKAWGCGRLRIRKIRDRHNWFVAYGMGNAPKKGQVLQPRADACETEDAALT